MSNSHKVVAVLQARFSSRRLPGKVLLPICGAPMIFKEIERINRSAELVKLILATSESTDDNLLVQEAEKRKILVHRGSLNDVLDRVYGAVKQDGPDYVVRLTGDCPLIDPAIIDETIRFCIDGDYDYASNCLEPSFPDGMDCEVIRFSALKRAWLEAKLPSEREHVTPFIYKNPEIFKVANYRCQQDLSHLRWTVDEQRDFDLVKIIYEELEPVSPYFGMGEVLDLFKRRPELQKMNADFTRNEGYIRSTSEDHQD